METVSLVASVVSVIVSVVLGLFAIWLSVTFYKMSTKLSDDTRDAARETKATAERLEKLFGSLYTDTFSMMRDTVEDMRKHAWASATEQTETQPIVEEKYQHKVEDIKDELGQQISDIVAKVGKTDVKLDQLKASMQTVVDEAIARSSTAKTEAVEETLKDAVRKYLDEHLASGAPISVGSLVDAMLGKGFHVDKTLDELMALHGKRIIRLGPPKETINYTRIKRSEIEPNTAIYQTDDR